MLWVEQRWKEKQDNLIQNGVNNVKQWALASLEVINSLTTNNTNAVSTTLQLICMFE